MPLTPIGFAESSGGDRFDDATFTEDMEASKYSALSMEEEDIEEVSLEDVTWQLTSTESEHGIRQEDKQTSRHFIINTIHSHVRKS